MIDQPPSADSRLSASFGSAPRRSLKAPRDDRAWLIDPPLDQIAALMERNAQQAEGRRGTIGGAEWRAFAAAAREELLAAAAEYTREFLGAESAARANRGSQRMVLAGHQPGLFHPGVWLKNFVLDCAARQGGATAVNLVIDDDVLRFPSVLVPGGTPAAPTLEPLAFDGPHEQTVWELRPAADRAVFESFAARASQRLSGLIERPLVIDYWPLVVARAAAGCNLGAALAQARRQWEGRWGVETLEVPQSRVCRLPSFRRWVACLLSDLPRLTGAYNQALAEYRRAHRVRNAAQPVPSLAVEDQRYEAPFWLIPRDGRRRRLFARRTAAGIEAADEKGVVAILPPAERDGGAAAAEEIQRLESQGVRLRTRALMTTLWARLFLGDLFIHGVGGAAYDEVTDRIIAGYFGVEPPEFAVVSGTLFLPVASPSGSADEMRRVARQLRELKYHPETAVPPPSDPAARQRWEELAAEKRRVLEGAGPPMSPAARHRAIESLNRALGEFAEAVRGELLDRLETARRAQHIEGILRRRDVPYVFYPASTLREFFGGLLHKNE